MGVEGYWRYSKETMQKLYDNGLLIVTENNLQKKYYEEQARQSRKSYDLVGYRFLNFFRNFISSEINGLQSIRQSQKYKSLDKDAQDDDSF